MKIFKNILVILLLCMQGGSLVAMKAEPATTKAERKRLKKALDKIINSADRKILKKALNVEINSGPPEFYNSKTDSELNSIIRAANSALVNEKVLIVYSKELKKTIPAIKVLLNSAIKSSNQALKKSKSKQLVKKAVISKEMDPNDRKILKKALNTVITNNSTFYDEKTDRELDYTIKLANKALADGKILDLYSKEFKRPIPEIKILFGQVIDFSNRALKKSKLEQQPQPANKVSPKAAKQPSPEALKKGGDTYSFYIMLDVQDFNAQGQPIHWKESIDLIASKIEGAKFEPIDYRHITLAWYQSDQSFAPDVLIKIERALTRANEVLKIFYPNGARGISLVDGAALIGRNKQSSVAFRVAESADLQKIQATLLKFLSFENIAGFKFNTFSKKTPLHVTLGKIKPGKVAKKFKDEVEHLDAPEGARASQGEDFVVNKFRATHSLPNAPYQEVGAYAF
jgi:hypothetical protein